MPLIHHSWQNFLYITGGEERLLEAELTLIKKKPNPYGLLQHDMLAIWIYTSTNKRWYETINARLRGAPSHQYIAFKDTLNSALRKMPTYKGVVYRGLSIKANFKLFMNNYKVGRTIRWNSFTSTAKLEEKAFVDNVLFIIRSKTGRNLSGYADAPEEDEVLFLAPAMFEVVDVEQEEGAAVITLDEVG